MKAAPTNAPAEATRVPTRLPSEKGAERATAAFELVEGLALAAEVEAPVDAGALEPLPVEFVKEPHSCSWS